jgi:hypothetical protein
VLGGGDGLPFNPTHKNRNLFENKDNLPILLQVGQSKPEPNKQCFDQLIEISFY